MARPSTYSDDMPEKVLDYVENYELAGDLLPSVEGLADHLSVHRDTIYEWAKHEDKAAFSDTLEALKRKQKKILMEKGLVGEYNPTITKLMLSHNHGVYEKSAQQITGADDGPVQVTHTKIVLVDPDA